MNLYHLCLKIRNIFHHNRHNSNPMSPNFIDFFAAFLVRCIRILHSITDKIDDRIYCILLLEIGLFLCRSSKWFNLNRISQGKHHLNFKLVIFLAINLLDLNLEPPLDVIIHRAVHFIFRKRNYTGTWIYKYFYLFYFRGILYNYNTRINYSLKKKILKMY